MGDRTVMAPVFIVGCPRSGTTLLQRLLDAHSLVAVTPETHFIRRFWFPREKYGDLVNDAFFRRVVNDVVAMPEFADMQLDADAFRADAFNGRRTIPALFDLLLRSFARRRGVPIVAEKTPNHLLYMPILEGFFPGARFIHIVRDPRAVVNSWRTVPWSTGTIAGDAGVWRRYMRTAWKQPPTRENLHVIRYEALVGSTEPVLRGICDFLDIPFERGMLTFHERHAETLDFAREPWKRMAAFPIQQRAVDGWRNALSNDQVAEIERLCWAEMAELGYAPEVARPPLLGRARRAVRRLVARAS